MLKTSVLILFFVCLTFQGELTAEVGGGFSIFSDQPLRNVLARAVSYKASLDPLNNYWNVRIPEITFGAYDSSKVDAYRAFLTSINQKSNWEKL